MPNYGKIYRVGALFTGAVNVVHGFHELSEGHSPGEVDGIMIGAAVAALTWPVSMPYIIYSYWANRED